MNRRARRAGRAPRSKAARGTPADVGGTAPPGDVATIVRRAEIAHRRGGKSEAERIYRQVIARWPDHPASQPAYANLGILLKEQEAFEAAEACLRKAIELKPDAVLAHNNLGNLLRTVGRPEAALKALVEAVRLDDRLALVHNNLGMAYADLGRLDDAVTSFGTALACDRRYLLAYFGLGACLRLTDSVDRAVSVYRRALALRPDAARAHGGLATALWDKGRLTEAIASFRTALFLDPHMADVRSSMLFAMCFSEAISPEALLAEHRKFDAIHAAPLVTSVRPHENDRDPARRLRIGYVSADFQLHPGGHFLMPHVMHHDRAQTDLFCYHTRPVSDRMTALFRKHAEHWRPAEDLVGHRLAQRVRDDRIDILVECSGHMAHNRLLTFAEKPAPVQVGFPLYPATSGLSAIDYRISDRYFGPPTADALHSEALVRMPDAHVCYFAAIRRVDRAAEPPFVTNGHITFGCFNNVAKLGETTLNAWARILQAVPEAQLHLGWRGLDGENRDRLGLAFAARGVSPRRLSFSGWRSEPYTRYGSVDICLDPLFANGGTTTCDALWMGVPVVTRYGDRPFSRVGLCHLTIAGLTDLIASDDDAYVRIAADLARDPVGLRRLRHGLSERVAATALFDAPRYAGHLDTAFRRMWRRWCAGAAPEAFSVMP